MVVPPLPDLTTLSHAQKDALIVALWEQVVSLTARLTALEQRLDPLEDTRQLQPAAVQRTEVEPVGDVQARRPAQGQPGPQGWWA